MSPSYYCILTFIDKDDKMGYMLTRALGRLHTLYLVCGNVKLLETAYYYSTYKELARMKRRLDYKPDLSRCASLISEAEYMRIMYGETETPALSKHWYS